MLWTVFFVLASFFAIIGLMEFVMCIMEIISTRSTKSLTDIQIVANIQGYEKNVEFVLGSLCVMAQRITFKNATTKVMVCAKEADKSTYQRIKEYVEENSGIYLIENDE